MDCRNKAGEYLKQEGYSESEWSALVECDIIAGSCRERDKVRCWHGLRSSYRCKAWCESRRRMSCRLGKLNLNMETHTFRKRAAHSFQTISWSNSFSQDLVICRAFSFCLILSCILVLTQYARYSTLHHIESKFQNSVLKSVILLFRHTPSGQAT